MKILDKIVDFMLKYLIKYKTSRRVKEINKKDPFIYN